MSETESDTECTCSIQTGCGEGSEAGCPSCRASDIYEPCPFFGGLCFPTCSDARVAEGSCDCEPLQREHAAAYNERVSS